MISQASRRLAGGILAAGIGLITFGVLILLLPVFFALLAALFFLIAGLGICITAIKIFFAQRRINKELNNESDDYRKNVRIKID
jgi:protein-S-isoprenylcysteine O-methyltransferase Ste14